MQSYPNAGTKWQVSAGRAAQPRWRADGKEIFFGTSGAGGDIGAVSVEANGPGLKFGAPKTLFDSLWAGSPHPNNTNFWTYAVSPDGQRFLIPRLDLRPDSSGQPQPLTVVLNW